MDAEYLNRPLIDDVTYEITETRVAIQSPHTCFVNCVLPERCQQKLLLDQYQRVYRSAKAQKVKISYTVHMRRFIQEHWNEYISEREAQEELFHELCQTASLVRQRGIHFGHGDDMELARLYKIRAQLDSLNYSNNAVRRIAGFENTLTIFEHQLTKGTNRYTMIAL